MADAFEALADPTRREILALLRGRPLAAGEIATNFPQQRPAISKHLAVLRRAGLVHETRDRQRRLYSLRPGSLEPIRALVASLGGSAWQSPRLGGDLPGPVIPPEPVLRTPRYEPPSKLDASLEDEPDEIPSFRPAGGFDLDID